MLIWTTIAVNNKTQRRPTLLNKRSRFVVFLQPLLKHQQGMIQGQRPINNPQEPKLQNFISKQRNKANWSEEKNLGIIKNPTIAICKKNRII